MVLQQDPEHCCRCATYACDVTRFSPFLPVSSELRHHAQSDTRSCYHHPFRRLCSGVSPQVSGLEVPSFITSLCPERTNLYFFIKNIRSPVRGVCIFKNSLSRNSMTPIGRFYVNFFFNLNFFLVLRFRNAYLEKNSKDAFLSCFVF